MKAFIDDLKLVAATAGGFSTSLFDTAVGRITAIGCAIYVWLRVWKAWRDRKRGE